ncbi:MAG TPA: hypothetical protein CFH79_03670 [Sulfurospirillum sp. UBA11407]|nr:MAG TPA: hypothetical protein CFH79_03670 [Sulfurospirillum sp. UBA11407]
MYVLKLFLRVVFVFFISSHTVFAQNYELKCVAEKALKEKKLLLISVVSENCYFCKKMDKDVFSNKRVIKKIHKQYERIAIIAGVESIPNFLHVEAYPTNFLIDPKTFNIIDEYVGYIGAKDFLELLDMVYKLEMSHKNVEND